jgi:MFS family permease
MTTLIETSRVSAARAGGRTLPRSASFWLVAGATATLLAASSAPSPLYSVYQAAYHFSALTLTAVFAVYVLALLLSLLTVGRLSDYLGRRPVLAVALVLEAAAMLVFLDAHSVAWLYAARIVQGVATGAAVGVLGAYLLDLQPPSGRLGSLMNTAAATGGLGIGAALTGVLVQYAPHPTRLVFVILTATFLLLVVVTAVLPETATPQPGARAALRPTVSVPRPARRAFLRAVPTMVSTWMLGGLILSVGGSVIANVFGQQNHAFVGVVLGGFAGAGAIGSVALREITPARMARLGTFTLLVGVTLFVVALATSSLALFVPAAVVAGLGFGPAFLGAFRAVSLLAEPHERAGLVSAIYVVSYLGLSIPALVAGLAISHEGLRSTALVYGVVVGAVALATLLYESVSARTAH